jgi:protein-S-isoprenylcysteine O-methyltransferase Ste14
MAQAVTRQGLGTAASNLLLAAMYLIFAYLHLNVFAATTRPSLLLVVAAESLLVVFILIRRDPDATWHSWWTWLTMLGGTFGPLLFRPTAAAQDVLVGQAVQIAGMVLLIAAVGSLSRSFGLLPAHRGVKSDGLYRWVRHPLYSAYALAGLGYVISNFSLYNAAILAAATGFQVLRIRNEEAFLRRYPDYVAYAERTRWRILPWVW